MERIKAVKHVFGNVTEFEKKLLKVIEDIQSEGYEVKVTHGVSESIYSAVVIGYINE